MTKAEEITRHVETVAHAFAMDAEPPGARNGDEVKDKAAYEAYYADREKAHKAVPGAVGALVANLLIDINRIANALERANPDLKGYKLGAKGK